MVLVRTSGWKFRGVTLLKAIILLCIDDERELKIKGFLIYSISFSLHFLFLIVTL